MFVFLLLAWSLNPVQAENTLVRIGVLAKRGEQTSLNRWQPTADYLSQHVPGYQFSVLPLAFERISQVVAAGEVDFVLTNPELYVEFEMRYGAGRLATLRNLINGSSSSFYGGVIFTRAEREDIRNLTDLKNQRFAAVDANSLGGYLMASREMQSLGIEPSEDTILSFTGTHDAVVLAVLQKQADAGTVRTDTLERMSAEGSIDLTEVKLLNPQHYPNFDLLVSTRLYPEWPFAKLLNTSDSLSHAVVSALMRMPADSPAAKAALIAGWTVPGNYQPVHDLLRELRAGPYADLGKISLAELWRQYSYWLSLLLLVLLLLSTAIAYVLRLNRRLRQTETDLTHARDNLAEKVRERTSDLEQSYRQLERLSQHWNDAFDAISDPIFIHDAQMHILQANPAYCKQAGCNLEQMRGRPYYDFFPRQDGPLAACRDFPEHLYPEGNELQLPNGDIFVSRSFGIRQTDKSLHYAIHILEEVTDVRRAESRRRILSRAVEQAGEGILILEPDRQVMYCNPGLKQLLGCEQDSENCRPKLESVAMRLVAPYFTHQFLQLFDDADRNNSASAEMLLGGTLGAGEPVFITVSVIRNQDSAIDGYVLTVLDLSKVRQAEQALTYRIGLESMLAEVASRLSNANPEDIQAEIDNALCRLAEFAGADRAYLLDYDTADATPYNAYEWCAQGIEFSWKDSSQPAKLDRLPWLRDKLSSGQAISLQSLAELPEQAVAERTAFQTLGICSLLNVSIHFNGVFAGFIGFDNIKHTRNWAEEDVRLLRTAGEIIINSLRRIKVMLKLQRSEASLAAAQHIAHMGNWDWNIVTDELIWSDEIYRIFGLQPQQFDATYQAFLDVVHPDDRAYVISEVNKAIAGETDYVIDHRIVLPEGSVRVVHEVGEVHVGETGQALRMIGSVQDVTELRQAESELKRLNRALRTLSLCNTTLVHAVQEKTLVNDICRILTESGGYRFVWVGYGQNDAQKTIHPVAHAGYEHGFLDILAVSWSEEPSGQNPAGYAIRSRETFIARDIFHNDQGSVEWRTAAMERGYVSVIALPLLSEGEVFGAIVIDSADAEAFDEAELLLLIEMAGDLAFGIRTLRNRLERERAEAALKKTEERYEDLYEKAPNAYVSVSPADGSLLQFNQALCGLLGYDRQTLANKNVFDLYADTEAGLSMAKQIFKRFTQGESVRDIELQMRHRDGHPIWVTISVDPVLDASGKVIESRSSIIDISTRKRAEEEERRVTEQLQRSLIQTIRAIAITIEKRDPYTAGHQERVAELAVQIGARMGLDPFRLEGLRLGATIHDIGKIAVPSEILNRPGRLDLILFNVIKAHPTVGYDIICGIEFPWPLAKMVVQHHERLDGSGYPYGLRDGEIMLESRILAVADVVEAMASHRPYRAALGYQAALDEIERGKGTIYDTEVVDCCQALFLENGSPWT
ncbi:hypothetical protein A1359_11205 [Methylomonas lenta]|uniref:PAS domain S-box protein n=1 Tax=Methylomonas lenta TaxID=980561 RepID=A0A177NBA8_9GAMM|nr:PhnD/SsuA/transferrin family substrate-binding protein [Methylomonas lenta]OAI14380.1 hypothetical protein A1359_11205 [Methylomonas lenta]